MKHIVTLSKPVDLSGIKQFLLIHITFLTKEGIQSCISKWCTEASRWTSLLNQLHTQKVHELKVQFAAALHFFQAHQCNNYSWISHNLAMHKKSFKDGKNLSRLKIHSIGKQGNFCYWNMKVSCNTRSCKYQKLQKEELLLILQLKDLTRGKYISHSFADFIIRASRFSGSSSPS